MKEYGKISKTIAFAVETLIVGTGASGLNAADLLYKGGARDIAIITEGIKSGTSRNTGSDKQTYYKLSLSGDDKDSVRDLAQDLFNGGCVDGDVALVEASLSTPSFLRLVELGVPFPTNRYGEYVGYKTDHDPHCHSAGSQEHSSGTLQRVYCNREGNIAGFHLLYRRADDTVQDHQRHYLPCP